MVKTKIVNSVLGVLPKFQNWKKTPLLFLNSSIIDKEKAEEIKEEYHNALQKVAKKTDHLRSNSGETFYILHCSHEEKCKQLDGKVTRFMQLKNERNEVEIRYFIDGRDHGDKEIHWKLDDIDNDHMESIFFDILATTWDLAEGSDEWAAKIEIYKK